MGGGGSGGTAGRGGTWGTQGPMGWGDHGGVVLGRFPGPKSWFGPRTIWRLLAFWPFGRPPPGTPFWDPILGPLFGPLALLLRNLKIPLKTLVKFALWPFLPGP